MASRLRVDSILPASGSNVAIGTLTQLNVSGIVSASTFVGDGSGLIGVVGTGSGVVVEDGGVTVGTAGTINFGDNLSVSAISAGIVTVTGAAGGGGDVVDDTTPQLGGDLDLNGKSITGTAATITATGDVNVIGVVTATEFHGDGSNLTGITATGSGIEIRDSGSTVGTASTIDFSTNLSVSSLSAGIVTITASGGSSIVGINTEGLSEFSNISAGVITATSFVKSGGTSSQFLKADGSSDSSTYLTSTGDGSNLTGIGVTVAATWTLVSGSGSDYVITGPGLDGNESDPTIYVRRGQLYQFVNSTGGHPFQIQYEGGNTGGTAYNDGIINNNAGDGVTLHWNVHTDAPDVLFYQCTSHTEMWGKIIVLGDVVSEGSWTAAAGTLVNIDTISGVANNNFKTAEYTLHIQNGANAQAQKVLAMQTGSTAYSQEFAIMYDSDLLVSIGASVDGGNFYLNATPETGISGVTTYRFTRQTIR